MNLVNEILQVCFDVHEKEKTPKEAQEEILRLFNVVGQSEQLSCDHEFTHKPLGGNVYCWKCCALQTR